MNWNGTGADKGSKAAANKVERLLHLDRSPTEQSDGSFKVFR